MKRSRVLFLLLIVTLLMALLMANAALANEDQRQFMASLKGANEVPPNESHGVGRAIVRVNRDNSALSYRLSAFNIDGVTQAHIHCGPVDQNGPVVLFLYGFNPDGIAPDGLFAQGTGTDEDIIPRDSSDVCPGGVASMADLIAHIRAGNAYVNVHTFDFPGGEIRGQLN